eukprot:Ihof_evm1s687 gene=Ihof_evmTU1s687
MTSQPTTPSVDPLLVVNCFLKQYYTVRVKKSQLQYMFYSDVSTLCVGLNGSTVSRQYKGLKVRRRMGGEGEREEEGAITEYFSANGPETATEEGARIQVQTVDWQPLANDGLLILVVGHVIVPEPKNIHERFVHTIHLVPNRESPSAPRVYYVLNDMLRYMGVEDVIVRPPITSPGIVQSSPSITTSDTAYTQPQHSNQPNTHVHESTNPIISNPEITTSDSTLVAANDKAPMTTPIAPKEPISEVCSEPTSTKVEQVNDEEEEKKNEKQMGQIGAEVGKGEESLPPASMPQPEPELARDPIPEKATESTSLTTVDTPVSKPHTQSTTPTPTPTQPVDVGKVEVSVEIETIPVVDRVTQSLSVPIEISAVKDASTTMGKKESEPVSSAVGGGPKPIASAWDTKSKSWAGILATPAHTSTTTTPSLTPSHPPSTTVPIAAPMKKSHPASSTGAQPITTKPTDPKTNGDMGYRTISTNHSEREREKEGKDRGEGPVTNHIEKKNNGLPGLTHDKSRPEKGGPALFLDCLPVGVTEDELVAMIKIKLPTKYNITGSSVIERKHYTNSRVIYGFVDFESQEAVNWCLKNKPYHLKGVELNVSDRNAHSRSSSYKTQGNYERDDYSRRGGRGG